MTDSRSTNPTRWRKRPVTIEAMQWDGSAESTTAVVGWVGHARHQRDGSDGCPGTVGAHYIAIDTLEGTMLASPGDWIIRGVSGEHYPCKPDIFTATYEPTDQTQEVA